MLEPGAPLPNLTVQDQTENTVSLHDFKGKPLVIYFYPKDNTPGCTIESCGFRDAYDQFQALGVTVIGISRDSAKKHQSFIAKHDLPFPLLADTESTICDAFGVIKQKSMFGKKYMGIERSTFLFDKNGILHTMWPNVKITGHVKAVLQAAKGL